MNLMQCDRCQKKLVFSLQVHNTPYNPSTLANSTLIILFSEMLKFSKMISSKSKKIVKDNSEYLGIFSFVETMF